MPHTATRGLQSLDIGEYEQYQSCVCVFFCVGACQCVSVSVRASAAFDHVIKSRDKVSFFPLLALCDVHGKYVKAPRLQAARILRSWIQTVKSNHVGARRFETNVIKRSTNKFDLTFLIKDRTC